MEGQGAGGSQTPEVLWGQMRLEGEEGLGATEDLGLIPRDMRELTG